MSMANDEGTDEETGETDSAAMAQKYEIAGFYCRVASAYDAVGPAVFSHLGERVVALAGIHTGARVLDVAAGRGANLFPAAEKVGPTGQVIGIDLASAMVEHTARAIRERGLPNAAMVQMDAEDLAFADDFFDCVLCSFAYFFFPHLERALAQFFRVLRPGGRLLFTAHGGTDQRWQWYEELLLSCYARHGLPWPATVGGGHRPTGELRELLAQAGFADIRAVPEEIEAVYADAEEWWAAKWTHGARRPLEGMPPAILQQFVAAVNTRMTPLRQVDGFHERWRILCMSSTKPDNL